jgi:NAD(P)-dependent dehydrogenase (short-subunit alcohol dehydrogenase family)
MGKALEGKVVLVTGAGGGIGRDIALMAAAEGAAVVVNDLGASLKGVGQTVTAAQAVVDEIKTGGGSAIADGGSVADPDAARAMVEAAVKEFGRIDAVVNNAGILRDGYFHKMSYEDFDAVVKVHLYGAFNTSRAAADYFREQESGALVHMTSTSGLIGNYAQANYAAAKLGIAALSKSLALDLKRWNVRSNCIAPFAWSRMIASIFAVRNNEILLMSQARPVRSIHCGSGWTAEAIADHAIPALKAHFSPLEVSADVFSWDPV